MCNNNYGFIDEEEKIKLEFIVTLRAKFIEELKVDTGVIGNICKFEFSCASLCLYVYLRVTFLFVYQIK